MRRIFDDLPRVRGAIKVVPEDFVVEEIPLHEPDGEGPHMLLWVEKRGRDTREVVEALAHTLRIPAPEIGVAGQKDRQAVTRQWISVPAHALPGAGASTGGGEEALDTHVEAPRPTLPSGEGWKVLSARADSSKLRVGRLLGKRFRMTVRGGGPDETIARRMLEELAKRGLPNYFGPQRFGRQADNVTRARELLKGERVERKRFKIRMYLSALQAHIFNEWLDRRLDDRLLDAALTGDLLRDRMAARETGEALLRHCEAPDVESEAVGAGRLDPTGPIFGARMRGAREVEAEREAAVLEAAGLGEEDFLDFERDAPGSRRPARAWLGEIEVETQGEDLLLSFSLERGAYATVALAQLGLTV